MRGKAAVFAVAAFACAGVFVPRALAGPHDALIAKHAAANGVPEALVRRVIRIESRGNARAVYAGNYGLMQIRLATARGVGYSGDAEGLLDPDTNLNYAVKYLAGAYRAAGCDDDRAVAFYRRGYYGAAQRECGEPVAAVMQVAQADSKPDSKGRREKALAKSRPDAAAARPDVIQPKVVRTETIETSKSGAVAVRPAGKFEPMRGMPPPVQQQAVTANAAPSIPTPANPTPAMPMTTPKTDRLKTATEPAAKFELASVPLPPVRPDIAPVPVSAPKHAVKLPHREVRKHEVTEKKIEKKKAEQNSVLAAAGESTSAVVSMLKKLVTPDKKSRKRAVEAEADPPSQVQAPQ